MLYPFLFGFQIEGKVLLVLHNMWEYVTCKEISFQRLYAKQKIFPASSKHLMGLFTLLYQILQYQQNFD